MTILSDTNPPPISVNKSVDTQGTTILLVRHGETDGNIGKRLHGRTDLPLTELGTAQAAALSQRIATTFEIDLIVTSPLARARATAEAIAGDQLLLELDESLQEINFGDYEDLPFDELMFLHLELLSRSEESSEFDFQWPNGESLSGFHRRVRESFADIRLRHSGKTIVVVTHNGYLGSLFAQLEGSSANSWRAFRFSNCSLSIVEFDSDQAVVTCSNDTAHLEQLQ